MKNNCCCGCGCNGCLFWMIILAALVLGSCGSVYSQSLAKNNSNSVTRTVSNLAHQR